MTKVNGGGNNKGNSNCGGGTSHHVDNTMVDCGNQRKGESLTVAFYMVRDDKYVKEDVGGSTHSIRSATNKEFQWFIPFTRYVAVVKRRNITHYFIQTRYEDEGEGEATKEESSDKEIVGEDSSVCKGDSHRLIEGTIHALVGRGKMENPEGSKDGEHEEVKGMTSKVVDESVRIKVQMRIQVLCKEH